MVINPAFLNAEFLFWAHEPFRAAIAPGSLGKLFALLGTPLRVSSLVHTGVSLRGRLQATSGLFSQSPHWVASPVQVKCCSMHRGCLWAGFVMDRLPTVECVQCIY